MTRRLIRAALPGLVILLVTAMAVVASSATMQRLHAGGRSLDGPVDVALVLGSGLNRLAVVTDDSHLPRAYLLACFLDACRIGRVAVPAANGTWSPPHLCDIGRETLAWWYNLAKVTLWSGLGAAGMSEERRGLYVR